MVSTDRHRDAIAVGFPPRTRVRVSPLSDLRPAAPIRTAREGGSGSRPQAGRGGMEGIHRIRANERCRRSGHIIGLRSLTPLDRYLYVLDLLQPARNVTKIVAQQLTRC